jgi:hypothetical protein
MHRPTHLLSGKAWALCCAEYSIAMQGCHTHIDHISKRRIIVCGPIQADDPFLYGPTHLLVAFEAVPATPKALAPAVAPRDPLRPPALITTPAVLHRRRCGVNGDRPTQSNRSLLSVVNSHITRTAGWKPRTIERLRPQEVELVDEVGAWGFGRRRLSPIVAPRRLSWPRPDGPQEIAVRPHHRRRELLV